ncbi:MAG: DUF4921 family protein [Chloroflexi bacterium AL-W]|nr:DUF4921 family protein [Chloroflexi bacterium AL-N1]NOK67126.1 DUF4921 family protein [Chloroflexi bacterium AL-N10]NOK74581.1 DUF4921 family protein [Chloroflexi bacterium AL-N5]NOK81728.1 DUF4921 family protein [Chloroflexi bacterium AL-W]NOK89198.1 DUF4921 family protein [Chloroflexi bacterium AL-N15]
MPELRQNLATREWVIISSERAKRPEEFVQPSKERVEDRPVYDPGCPFCPGNEEHELEQLRLPTQGDWQVRVVRNKYPALREDGDLVRHVDGLNHSISGIGYHEVIVETPIHNTCPALESEQTIEQTLRAFQLRGLALREDSRVEQLVFFKNHGRTAGASLMHPHTQLLALPVVPYDIRTRVESARRYFLDWGECLNERIRKDEEQQGVRMIYQTDYFSAFIPFAAFSPFHLWIAPHRRVASFLDALPEELRELSIILRQVIRKLYFGLNDPDYNYVIRSAPESERDAEYLQWYVSIVPRVSRMAGFELGSGMFINSALPEESAAFLRSVNVPDDEA